MDEEFKRLINEKLKVHNNNEKMQEFTLRALSMKAVIYNAEFFVNNSSLVPRVENLPVALLSELENLAYNTGHPGSEKSWPLFLPSLFHHRLIKLHFPSFGWHEDEFFLLANALDEVGAKCSGLRLIDSNMFLDNHQPCEIKKVSLLKGSFFRALPKLRNLQIVRMHFFYFDDWALQQVAMHGENIVLLQVLLAEEASEVGIKALAKLPHLQQFLFDHRGEDEFRVSLTMVRKFVLLCAQHLPNLRIVGCDFDALGNRDLFYFTEDEDPDEIFHHSEVVQLPLQLGLEQLLLSGQVVTNPCCLLPNLRSVMLFRPVGDVVGFCSRYSTFYELGFYEAESDKILAALQVVGQRLQKLVLCKNEKLPMSKIIQLCPNLKHLQVVDSELDSSDYSWSKGALTCLQTVVLNAVDEPLPMGFIAKLLGAPLLKEVEIWQIYLTEGEVETLLALVRQGSILRNVERFDWDNKYYYKDSLQPWMASENQFQLLLDTVEVLCPNLKPVPYRYQ